jgi:crotonobetainyl-CoA:carnitine CoA-transferase CaiB-like acyl-CoA transferase
MLSPYRVLDLCDERGQLAGMLLGDLGADVIRVEPPGGSDARRVGPFLDDGPEAERSLSFAAYNRNKRSVTLDFGTPEGRASFLDLVAGSDFVLDSGPPSLLDAAGLGFERLRGVNPQIVHVRTTPFGCDGPYANHPFADLTIASLGGPVALQGEADRAPVRMSVPQVWRHAGAETAVAALVAHTRMRTTGDGVFVDVSAQAAMAWTTLNASVASAIQGRDMERMGCDLQIGPTSLPLVHACKDGHLIALGLGALFGLLRPWMLEAGVIDEAFLDREDWTTYDSRFFRGGNFEIPIEELTDTYDRFFATRTKRELFEPGLAIGATLAPVQTLDDLLSFHQLAERGYFTDVELANGKRVKAPGAFAKSAGAPLARFEPAPRLGQHTGEVLDELEHAPRKRTPFAVDEPAAFPFQGLKVADFSWVGVGPISGKYLADHGADVIRVESQNRADVLRAAGPYKDDEPGWNRSHYYGEFNTSKRSLGLDLKHERAGEVSARLLAWADVVLESFTPGAADRLGIGYDAARAANPGVILVSTCLMGQTGPAASMAGYGYHAAGVAGFYEVAGWPDRPPAGPWQAYTDTIAPRFLTTTLIAALDHKRRSGEGCHIDLGQLEAALHFLAPEILARQATGEHFTRMGNRAKSAAPQGVYPCGGNDEWCAIAVEDDAQWRALRAALGDPEWARASELDTLPGRLAAHAALDAGLAAWTRAREPRDAMETLLAAGVPAGHVQRSSDLLVDPQLRHRAFHREFEHAEMGRVPYSGHQFRISGYDSGPRGPAPLLGGESFEILGEELGFDVEAIADLMASGAIG